MIDKGQWWEFGQDTGVTPYSLREVPGIFNDHRESGPRFKRLIRILPHFCHAEQKYLLYLHYCKGGGLGLGLV